MSAARWPVAWTCLLMACSSARSQGPVFVAADVLPKVVDREKMWTEPRTSLAMGAGEVSTCAGYAQLRASGMADDGHNHLVRSEYLICDVLQLLKTAPNLKPLPADSYGTALASRLDLRSFPSSLGPRVDDERYTLSRLFESQVRVDGDQAVVETPDLFFALSIVVVGDVDHSGKLDWVVWLSDEVLAGTYRDYETLLIKDVAPEGLLRAQRM